MNQTYKEISSDYLLEDLYHPFKVIAGPGAGKTYWLEKNIRHILQKSELIHSTSKIACITYTNVGANEVIERLNLKERSVESTTIHSFLFKNIVKPYVYLLKNKDGESLVNYHNMSGHEKSSPTTGSIYEWRKQYNVWYFDNTGETTTKIKEALEDLDWIAGDENEIKLGTRKYHPIKDDNQIRREDLLNYKKYCWSKGIVHHEDVLYFSFKLLELYPIIKELLIARYPYILIDEFQDTNPLQVEIIKLLADAGAIVGVIGDPAQSIYKFNGASRQAFIDFQLRDQHNYIIKGNRRSGTNIVQMLNKIRGDGLDQFSMNEEIYDEVFFIEYTSKDDVKTVIDKFKDKRKSLNLSGKYCVLARNNPTVTKLKNDQAVNLWQDLEEIDNDRYYFLSSILKAQEYGYRGMIDFAIKECIKAFRTKEDNQLKGPFRKGNFLTTTQKRGISVSLLEQLITNRHQNMNVTVLDFYNKLSKFFIRYDLKLVNVRKGAFETYSKERLVRALVDDTKLDEEKNSKVRTIHKAKGAEFESVLVYLENIDKLVNLDINSDDDETRILYVACSRAERLLCIAVPKDSEEN